MESDSKIIIDAMTGINASPVTIDNIFYGIRQKLREFRNLQLSHVSNCPSYILAHYDKNTDNYVTWIKKKNHNMIESVVLGCIVIIFFLVKITIFLSIYIYIYI